MMRDDILLLVLLLSTTFAIAAEPSEKSPVDHLPPHITRLTPFGERADWSHDGKRILFLAKTFGDAIEVDLATRQIRNSHRALPAPRLHPRPVPGQRRHPALRARSRSTRRTRPRPRAVLPLRARQEPDQAADAAGHEMLARARPSRASACTSPGRTSAAEYPDEMPRRHLAHAGGRHRRSTRTARRSWRTSGSIARQPRPAVQVHAGDAELPPARREGADLQRLRPPGHRRLRHRPGDEEGRQLLQRARPVRRARRASSPTASARSSSATAEPRKGPAHVDLWKLTLDGSGQYERLTYFNDYPGYKASNPVVSDDGKFMAFQMARCARPRASATGSSSTTSNPPERGSEQMIPRSRLVILHPSRESISFTNRAIWTSRTPQVRRRAQRVRHSHPGRAAAACAWAGYRRSICRR